LQAVRDRQEAERDHPSFSIARRAASMSCFAYICVGTTLECPRTALDF
jgi:hypothetical protein